jgi:hypothetical protein
MGSLFLWGQAQIAILEILKVWMPVTMGFIGVVKLFAFP